MKPLERLPRRTTMSQPTSGVRTAAAAASVSLTFLITGCTGGGLRHTTSASRTKSAGSPVVVPAVDGCASPRSFEPEGPSQLVPVGKNPRLTFRTRPGHQFFVYLPRVPSHRAAVSSDATVLHGLGSSQQPAGYATQFQALSSGRSRVTIRTSTGTTYALNVTVEC